MWRDNPEEATLPHPLTRVLRRDELSCDTSRLGRTNLLPIQAGGNSDEVFVRSIDNGTTSSRFLIFDTKGNQWYRSRSSLCRCTPYPGYGSAFMI
jgi:hypothetical protein